MSENKELKRGKTLKKWVDEERKVFKRMKKGFYQLGMEDKKEAVEYVEFLGEVGVRAIGIVSVGPGVPEDPL